MVALRLEFWYKIAEPIERCWFGAIALNMSRSFALFIALSVLSAGIVTNLTGITSVTNFSGAASAALYRLLQLP